MLFDQSPSLTPEHFAHLARIIYSETGIVFTEGKRGLMLARLNRRLRSLGLSDYGAYCELLESSGGEAERRNLLSAVTTNVTDFFREIHHFETFSQQILPDLVKAAKRGERVRLWSAACSSGEEPYSLAMVALEAFPDAARHDFLILASDIDPVMVAKAEAAVYSNSATQNLSASRIDKFFIRHDNSIEVRDNVKNIVRFAEINLHQEWPFAGKFNVIFCRNVVIYFDAASRQRLWQRFEKQLCKNGHLFIGHSERLDGPASFSFRLVSPTHYIMVTP